MRTRVQRWLSAPKFLDEEQTRIARLLNLMLLTLILLIVLDAILLLVFAPETIPTFWINGVVILVACLLLWMMRRGYVRLAGIILCLTMWPLVVYYIGFSGGLDSPALAFLGLFIVIGVTLFGTRGAIGLGLLNIVCIGGLYLGGTRGLFVSLEGLPTLSRLFATNSMVFLLLTALVTISGLSVHGALIRAKNGELTLAERNRELNREIAERKTAQEALHSSRETLQAIIDVSPLAIALFDMNNTVQLWNPAAEHIFGWTAQEIIGQTNPLIPTEYQEEYRSLIGQIFETGSVIAQEVLRQRKDGTMVTVSLSSAALYDSLGRPRARMAVSDDITERKRAKDTLQRSEANMRAILDNSALSYVLLDSDKRVITVNRQAQQGAQAVFGRNIQPGDLFTEFLSDSSLDDFYQNFDRAMRGETAFSERIFVTPQGETRHLDFRYFPAVADHRQVLGVCLSGEDTTEREQAQSALRESEQKFRALSEQSLMGISIMQDNKLKYVNQAVAGINGYSVEEMLDWNQTNFDRSIHPDDLTFAAGQVQKQGSDLNLITRYQYRIVTKLGQIRWVEQFSKTVEFGGRPANLGVLVDITERQQAEDALRVSEERYRVLSEMISDYAFSILVGPDGAMKVEWITDSFTRMTGYTLSEMLEREMQQPYALFHPEDHGLIDADMMKLLQGEPTDNEYRMLTKTDEMRWMHFYRHPVWDDMQQRVVRYYGIVQDITQRRRAEQELQRRDAILQAVSTATNYFLRATDWQQEIVNVLGILGKAARVDRATVFQSHPDINGRPLASLHYEWDAANILPMRDNPLAQNLDLLEIEFGTIIEQTALREPVYFHVKDRPPTKRALGESTGTKTFSLHPILLHGALWGALVLSMTREERDWSKTELEAVQIAADMLGTVMERKQAEDALYQSAARLNILHRIDRAILAAESPQAIAQAALQAIRQLTPLQTATIEFVDFETAERVLLAVDVNGGHRQHVGNRLPLDPSWIETFKEGDTYFVADIRSSPDALPIFQNLMDESVRSLAVMPLIAHNKVLGSLDLMATEPNAFTPDYLEIGREVADQLAIAIEHAQLYELAQRHAADLEQRVQERTAQLEVANKELRVLSRMKDEFVSNVSHELRTPITSLKLRYYLLAKQPNQLDAHLSVIQRETERLARIIEDLLALSRMDQDSTQLSLTVVNLNSLIQQFVADRVLLAESRELTLNTVFFSGAWPVQADAGLLEQVLSILLTNALNYTPRGGQVIVGTTMRQIDNHWWTGFSVSDTGPGISRKDQDKLFARFSRGQAGRESGISGTGLGLALAKEVVERHGGQIEVDSEGVAGRGTIFKIWLRSWSGDVQPVS